MRIFFRIVFLIGVWGFVAWWVIPKFVLGQDIADIWPWLLGGLFLLAVPLNIWALRLRPKRTDQT